MNDQRLRFEILLAAFMLSLVLSFPAIASEIDSCKYLSVIDFTNDPYGIAKELRAQASARGFTVVSKLSDVPPSDLFRACIMRGSWSAGGYGGQIAMRVEDAGGEILAEAETSATAWWTVSRTVHGAVTKIFNRLGYRGYDEEVYRHRIEHQYPSRPKVATTEDEIKKREPSNQVEGIWTDTEDKYRLGIVPAPTGSGADYVAVVLRSSSPLWAINEIKAEIRSTASPDLFTCTYFLANKKPVGTTLILDHKAVLHGSLATPSGTMDLLLMRVWPRIARESVNGGSITEGSSGTGFMVTSGGLFATNWHVIADAKNVSIALPGWANGVSAEVILKDATNDLAILRLTDSTRLASTCPELPFQLSSSKSVTLGQKVSTIGYPLTPILGSNPKFAEGVVSSKTGFQDDPRTFQISAQVQPGSSGSPLFDSEGNVIGVVVATLDAIKVYQVASAIPQNVNFAIKADYLLNLVSMLPNVSLDSRRTSFSPDRAARCVAIVTAQ